MKREHPILFSAPLVRAILAGQKTQTRRVCRVQPRPWQSFHGEAAASPASWKPGLCEDGTWDLFSGDAATPVLGFGRCPYGRPGDALWVRETFYVDTRWEGRLPKEPTAEDLDSIYYRADGECCDVIPECQCADVGKLRWRPSIHMPRWASRLSLEVTEVRVERLQDITEEDARAEGVEPIDCAPSQRLCDGSGPASLMPHKVAFGVLWDTINDKRERCSWADNPWVFAISFRRVE